VLIGWVMDRLMDTQPIRHLHFIASLKQRLEGVVCEILSHNSHCVKCDELIFNVYVCICARARVCVWIMHTRVIPSNC
jgi:hypothetical protein